MKANPTRFWIIVIALGWAFDFLFLKKPGGVNFSLVRKIQRWRRDMTVKTRMQPKRGRHPWRAVASLYYLRRDATAQGLILLSI